MSAFSAFVRRSVMLAGGLALAGCVNLGGGKAPPTLLTLSPAQTAPAGASAQGTPASAIVVLEPETDRRLAVQRVAVQVDPSNIAYLKDAMWVERPSRLFRDLLAETIRAKTGRLVFTGAEASSAGALRLSGRLLDADYDAQSRAAVLRYDAIRESADGKIETRRFAASVPVSKADGETVGAALNRAADQVADDVAAWIVP